MNYKALTDDQFQKVLDLMNLLKALDVCKDFFINYREYHDTIETIRLQKDKGVSVDTSWTPLNKIEKIIVLF